MPPGIRPVKRRWFTRRQRGRRCVDMRADQIEPNSDERRTPGPARPQSLRMDESIGFLLACNLLAAETDHLAKVELTVHSSPPSQSSL